MATITLASITESRRSPKSGSGTSGPAQALPAIRPVAQVHPAESAELRDETAAPAATVARSGQRPGPR